MKQYKPSAAKIGVKYTLADLPFSVKESEKKQYQQLIDVVNTLIYVTSAEPYDRFQNVYCNNEHIFASNLHILIQCPTPAKLNLKPNELLYFRNKTSYKTYSEKVAIDVIDAYQPSQVTPKIQKKNSIGSIDIKSLFSKLESLNSKGVIGIGVYKNENVVYNCELLTKLMWALNKLSVKQMQGYIQPVSPLLHIMSFFSDNGVTALIMPYKMNEKNVVYPLEFPTNQANKSLLPKYIKLNMATAKKFYSRAKEVKESETIPFEKQETETTPRKTYPKTNKQTAKKAYQTAKGLNKPATEPTVRKTYPKTNKQTAKKAYQTAKGLNKPAIAIEKPIKPTTTRPKTVTVQQPSPPNTTSMKPNLKQANARIKAIMESDGLTYKEAQKRYWSAYKNNIGYKVAKLRKTKETEAQKAARAQEGQSKSAFKKQCHNITGTTTDGLKIKIQLTQPVTRKARKTKTGTQPGSANY